MVDKDSAFAQPRASSPGKKLFKRDEKAKVSETDSQSEGRQKRPSQAEILQLHSSPDSEDHKKRNINKHQLKFSAP